MSNKLDAKVKHVKAAPQTREHQCHWPGCSARVPPAKWGCTRHWYSLPEHLRRRVWAAYRIGQEEDRRPSAEYLEVTRDIQEWIAARRKEDQALADHVRQGFLTEDQASEAKHRLREWDHNMPPPADTEKP